MVAQASLIVSITALAGIGGAGGAWVGDRALGIGDDSPREIVAEKRGELPVLGLIGLFGAMAGLFAGWSLWPKLARHAGFSEEEIRELMKRQPSAPDA